MIARANWSTDPQTVLRAIPVEPTRGEVQRVDLSGRQIRLLLSLPLYDGSRKYPRYRVTLAAPGKQLWGRTLRAPTISLTDNAHILNLVLFPKQLSGTGPYDLQVEGWTQGLWQPLGHVLLNPVK